MDASSVGLSIVGAITGACAIYVLWNFTQDEIAIKREDRRVAQAKAAANYKRDNCHL